MTGTRAVRGGDTSPRVALQAAGDALGSEVQSAISQTDRYGEVQSAISARDRPLQTEEVPWPRRVCDVCACVRESQMLDSQFTQGKKRQGTPCPLGEIDLTCDN